MERTAVAVESLVTLKGVLQMVTMVEGKNGTKTIVTERKTHRLA